MGGVGIATRNNRYINYLNPAAVTARDSLSFMADFGLQQSNNIYKQGDIKSAHNTFNIYDFVTGVGCHFLLQCMKVKVKSLSRVRPSATPWTAAFQAPLSMGFPGKSTGVGCHCLLHFLHKELIKLKMTFKISI